MSKEVVFGKGKRPTLEDIKAYVSESECRLVSNVYKNQDTKMDFECSCGESFSTTLRVFRSGARCSVCQHERLSKRFRTPYEEVKSVYTRAGCKLLSTSYKNAVDPLTYVCKCGNKHIASLNSFKRGARCPECQRTKIMSNRPNRFSYDYVKSYFEAHGCTLISTHYQNGKYQKLDYICKCGRPAKIMFRSFKAGQRCFQCMVDGLSGVNSKWYNPNITAEERELRDKKKRKMAGYRPWKRQVHERDSYKCVKCSSSEELEAHHLYSFAEHIGLRFEVNNGVTLCKTCHVDFHTIYTTMNNTKEQFDKYMNFGR